MRRLGKGVVVKPRIGENANTIGAKVDVCHERSIRLWINHDARRFRYAINDSPMPISDYMGTVEITETDGGGTQVSWSAEFNVVAEARDDILEMLRGAFSDGISGIEKDLQ